MALRKSTRPLPRTPRVTARTPLIKSAQTLQSTTMTATAGSLPTAMAAAGVTAPAPANDGTDATASMAVAFGTTTPVEVDEVAAALTTGLRDKILDVVTDTVRLWLQLAHFDNVTIQAVAAIASPGCLRGPRLRDYRQSSSAYHATEGLEREIMDMALRGISDNFALWQSFVMIPGLPLYPAFAAMPMAVAPPTPAVPMPLSAFVSNQLPMIVSEAQLSSAILSEAPNDLDHANLNGFCNNLGKCCAMAFQVMVASQVVVRLMGTGPVPAYAPPMMPVGPVMGGSVIAAPGIFASPGSFSIPKMPLVL